MLWDKIKTILSPSDKEVPVRQQTATQAMKETIRDERKSDPLIGPKLGGRALAQSLISGLRNQRGVHIETLLCALGSLAGYSCQASVREVLVKQGGQPEEKAFVIANGEDGKKYFFGDSLNKPLAEDQYSVWNLAAGITTHLGCQQPVNVEEILNTSLPRSGGPNLEFRESQRATGQPIRRPIE